MHTFNNVKKKITIKGKKKQPMQRPRTIVQSEDHKTKSP